MLRNLRRLLFVFGLALGAPAWAQEAPPTVSLRIEDLPPGVEPEKLREAIARELGVPVALAETDTTPALVLGKDPDARARMTFFPTQGEIVSRTIDLPPDPAAAVEVLALLAGNLARDEARELLGSLRREPEPAPVPAPAATTAPAPTPAPATASPTLPVEEPRPHIALHASLFHPLAFPLHAERAVVDVELGMVYSRVGGIHAVGVSGFVLRVDGDVDGAAGAGFVVHTRGAVDGLVVGGLVETGSGAVDGLALGGTVAWNRRVRGVQAAGTYAQAGEIDGLQVGLVNVAGRVRGLQVGLVNVARETTASVGLVSIAGNGRVQPRLTFDSNETFGVAIAFVAGWAYTTLGAGSNADATETRAEAGIGLHVDVFRRAWIEAGLHSASLLEIDRVNDVVSDGGHAAGPRLAVGVEVLPKVTIFAAASLLGTFDRRTVEPEFLGGVAFF